MPRRAATLLACLGLAGCADLSPYARSRWADLADVVPASLGLGWGVSASLQATPFAHVGLGLTPVVNWRWGWQDRSFNGGWHEFSAAFPWSPFVTDISPVPPRPRDLRQPWWSEPLPLVYRWQVRRDAPSGEGELPGGWEPQLRQWGRHPPISRETSGALGLPESARELGWHDLRLVQGDPDPFQELGSPARATLWEVSRDGRELPRPWDLLQADVMVVFLGLRVGLRPLEAVDFLAGLVDFDPSGDDYDTPRAASAVPAAEASSAPQAAAEAPPTAPGQGEATKPADGPGPGVEPEANGARR